MITGGDSLVIFLIWGVWLLIPLVSDGLATVWQFVIALLGFRRNRRPHVAEARLPRVSVVIPAHNEQANIDRCIISVKAQTYPHHLIEIIIVDDASQDKTVDHILSHIGNWHPHQNILQTNSFTVVPSSFNGVINVVRRKRGYVLEHGKAAAVNAALDLISGEIIVAIDADVVLEPHAIENAVHQFLLDDQLVAATGHLIIDPYLVVVTDETGNPVRSKNGTPTGKTLSVSERFLTACQFLEYTTTFHLGRYAESQTDSMFTIAGACAVFRRSVFAHSGKYQGRTVSEDADLTLSIHQQPNQRVGYLPGMLVHLAPVLSWSALYSQRTRWQRGELEVIAVHERDFKKKGVNRFFWYFALPLRLQVDHTLAMPRLVWTLLLFMLPLFGYSWTVIGQALLLLVAFYTILNTFRILVAYLFSSPPEKVFIRKYLAYIPALGLYNIFLFWTRMSAVLRTMTEDAKWNVHNPLLDTIESGALRHKVATMVNQFLSIFS